jgi:hypothetical protein
LPPNAIEGGTDGFLTTEATTAKRKEIAAAIRKDAATQQDPAHPLPGMLRLGESLVYEQDDATLQQFTQMSGQYVDSLKALPPDKLSDKKDEALRVRSDFRYLVRWKIVPPDFAPNQALQALIKDQGWDKKK